MDKLSIFTLKAFRKLYTTTLGIKPKKPECEKDPDKVSQIIYEALMADKPCMIARFGSTELQLMTNYLGVKYPEKFKNSQKFIQGKTPAWWWEPLKISQIQTYSGFFPCDINKIEMFCDLMIKDTKYVDILGSWREEEAYFDSELSKCKKVNLELLNPYFSKTSWTKALENKKVLVVHPFSKTIEQQYKKRKLLFQNNLLPEFNLQTIKAVQSLAGEKTAFNDWFEALESMKSEIDKHDYDICLIGAGAYGFPLAAHVKRMGKKGFHLGGSLQLLFGIRGKRWENKNYNPIYNYSSLINDHWVKPNENERPNEAHKIENACYW